MQIRIRVQPDGSMRFTAMHQEGKKRVPLGVTVAKQEASSDMAAEGIQKVLEKVNERRGSGRIDAS